MTHSIDEIYEESSTIVSKVVNYKENSLPEKCSIIAKEHPHQLTEILSGKHLSIDKFCKFAENNFEALKEIFLEGSLVKFIASEILPLEYSLEVFHEKQHMKHLFGIVEDSLMDKSISFEEFLTMHPRQVDVMHKFKSTEEVADYVKNIVGDMPDGICLGFE